MTDETSIPQEDDATYWGPIVEQRLQDFWNVKHFLKKHKVPAVVRNIIHDAGRSVLLKSVEYGIFGAWSMDEIEAKVEPNAAWAGILKQAVHQMREKIFNYCPDLYPSLPKTGEPRTDRER